MKLSLKNNFLLLLVIPLILWIIIYGIFGFDGLYGQDAYEYLRYSKALYNFVLSGENPGDYFWPLYYPLVGTILNFFIKNPAAALQLISVISLGVSSVYFHKTLSLIHHKKTNAFLYTLFFFMMSPVVFRMSLLVMSDMLAVCFIVICCYHSLKFYKLKIINNLYLATIFGICAIMTRYASFIILFPFALYLLYLVMSKKRYTLHIPILLLISFLLVFPHIYFRNEQAMAFLNHSWLQEWSIMNFFKISFITVDGHSTYKLPNIIYAFSNLFHPRYFYLGSILIIVLILKKKIFDYFWLLLTSFLLYSIFLAGIPFQNTRFLLLSYPIGLIIIFPAFNVIVEKFSIPSTRFIIFSLIAVLHLFLCVIGMKSVWKRNIFEKQIVEQIRSYQNNTLYSFDVDIAIKGRGLEFDFKNLWVKEYDSFDENALVLFHPTKFTEQWKEKNPILNWNSIQTNYNLIVLEEGPEGWKLYKIVK